MYWLILGWLLKATVTTVSKKTEQELEYVITGLLCVARFIGQNLSKLFNKILVPVLNIRKVYTIVFDTPNVFVIFVMITARPTTTRTGWFSTPVRGGRT